MVTGVASVFGEDEDSDGDESREETFERKFGTMKARGDRAVQKVLEDDATIYDYDGHLETVERRKKEIQEVEKEKGKDRKARFCS